MCIHRVHVSYHVFDLYVSTTTRTEFQHVVGYAVRYVLITSINSSRF